MVHEDFLDRLRRMAAEVFGGTPIVAAYAHGSRIAGRPRPDSDLDIGYYCSGEASGPPLPLAEELRLADALSRALGIEVDLRHLGHAPLDVRGRVFDTGVRIFSGDDVARVTLERETLARYHDYKSEFQAIHELRLASRSAASR